MLVEQLLRGTRMPSFAASRIAPTFPISSNSRCCFASKAVDSTLVTRTLSQQEKCRLTTLRLYRILQRTCRSIPSSTPFLLQPDLDETKLGLYAIFRPPKDTRIEELYRWFYAWNEDDDRDDDDNWTGLSIEDWYHMVVSQYEKTFQEDPLPPMTNWTVWTTREQLQQALRIIFRLDYDDDEIPHLHRWSIRAVQVLGEQQSLWKSSSVAETEGIRVTATSRCIGTTSPPATITKLDRKFRFAYRIRVENLSDQYVQLLGRHWQIQEEDQSGSGDEPTWQPVVVDAPMTGAVGNLPVLSPGQAFEYMSGTDLHTTRGTMQGHFYMAKVPEGTRSAKSGDDVKALKLKEKLEITVAPFLLIA